MKTKYSNIAKLFGGVAVALSLGACNDYLDITPPSQVSPESYFNKADQLAAYTINMYGTGYGGLISTFDNGGSGYQFFLNNDQGTDNENGTNNKFFDGASKVLVGNTGGSWGFGTINSLNYFFEQVLPRREEGSISGASELINHYIGEAYFLRALTYFGKLKSLGDFPIVTSTQVMDKDSLILSSQRAPRNEVARFILKDLDLAIENLSDGSLTGGRNRITRDVAYLLKARVALYEATFEKYFAGTPFVPDRNAGWPGASKDYNADFVYDNASEVAFFLNQALEASKVVADKHTLATNNKKLKGTTATSFPNNQYYDMFCTQDPSNIDEALMFRSYDLTIGGGHCLNQYLPGGGFTQEFQGAFLMANGLPIYADGSGYAGDDFVQDTKKDRDYRWQLFTKAPGEWVYSDNSDNRVGCSSKVKTAKDAEFIACNVVSSSANAYYTSATGYHKAKGWATLVDYSRGGHDLSAAILFRAAEAYLIYLEAAWEKYGDGLNSYAWAYWGALRERAGLPYDANVTINATDLDKEEYYSHDLALYSAGKRIESKVLYNIRRERRCELMSEGFRWDDLMRWRALDQLKEKRFFKHGAKIFGPMLEYMPKKGNDFKYLKFDQANPANNNVSSPTDVEGGFNGDPSYLSLLRVSSTTDWYESGYSWRMAHYLDPIGEDHFVQTAPNGDLSTSPIYQNPYWDLIHDTPAQK